VEDSYGLYRRQTADPYMCRKHETAEGNYKHTVPLVSLRPVRF